MVWDVFQRVAVHSQQAVAAPIKKKMFLIDVNYIITTQYGTISQHVLIGLRGLLPGTHKKWLAFLGIRCVRCTCK